METYRDEIGQPEIHVIDTTATFTSPIANVEAPFHVTSEVLDEVFSPRPLDSDWLADLPSDFGARLNLAEDQLAKSVEEGLSIPDDLWLKIGQDNRRDYLMGMIQHAKKTYRGLQEADRKKRQEWRKAKRLK